MIVLVYIYGGLVLFTLFIVYDTQMIIEKTHNGDFDYVTHSLTLFIGT